MKSFIKISSILALVFLAQSAFAAQGLVIHSAEFGVGKFHRADNKVHAYPSTSAWFPYILPDGAATSQPLTIKNADGSFTIFFSTLDDLISSVVQVSQSQKQLVSVLNVHGHGLPGGMWFPKDVATMNDFQCSDWLSAATGSDDDNYSQYYSAVSVDEIQEIRDASNNPAIQMGCVTGAAEWKDGIAKNPAFLTVFAPDAQAHFLSCVVGLGSVGQDFTLSMSQTLMPNGGGRLEASMDFGLGDWSMPNGMGFWDYQTDAQVDHDNSVYVVDHRDSEIAQQGSIRMATFANGAWSTSVVSNVDTMKLFFETQLPDASQIKATPISSPLIAPKAAPARLRVPGTTAYVPVL